MSWRLDYYWARIKVAMATMVQYRTSNIIWLLAMMVEPVVYLVVWSTVARSQGGSVVGYTPGTFAVYYIVWTLVRHINIALTPYAFEGRLRRGTLSNELLKPVHPFHLIKMFVQPTMKRLMTDVQARSTMRLLSPLTRRLSSACARCASGRRSMCSLAWA